MEAAQAWGLTPSAWQRQSADDRARMIAHEYIKNLRQAYISDQLRQRSEKSSASTQSLNDYDKMKLKMGLR